MPPSGGTPTKAVATIAASAPDRSAMKSYLAQPCTEQCGEHIEGPTWDTARQELLWVDILRGLVHRGQFNNTDGAPRIDIVRTFDVGQCVGAVAPFSDLRLGWILASERGFAQLWPDGQVCVIAEPEAAKGGRTRMNDGKCDPAGRFWAGSMAWDLEAGAGNLYRLGLDGNVAIVVPTVTISNGMAWTGDGRTLYYIDTPTRNVDRFDIDPRSGAVLGRQTAFTIGAELGSPDGMTIDDEGCLWIAMWGASSVVRYTTDGQVLSRVSVGAEQVSSCAFGGRDGRSLFITTSQEGLTSAERGRQPDSGRVFHVKVDVTGPAGAPCRAPISDIR